MFPAFCGNKPHSLHTPSRSDAHMQPDLLPHSSPCRAPREICTERAAQHPINRVPRTVCRARSITLSTASQPHRSRWAALLMNRVPRTFHSISTPQVSLGCPFGNPTEQAAPRPSQWEAELHRIRLHAREGRHQWQSACHLSKMGSRAPPP